MPTDQLISIKASLTGWQRNAVDLGTPEFPLSLSQAVSLAYGTGAGQADRVFTDTRTLAASASESLDLAAGSLVDAFGATFTVARIKAVLIMTAVGNTNDVNFSRPAANGVPLFAAASDQIAVQPGGIFLWASPAANGVLVTAGTGDLLGLANSGAGSSVTYSIVIVGASA